MMRRIIGVLAVGLLVALGVSSGVLVQGQVAGAGVITGVVTSDTGPEAGVWVIAETSDLPTKYRKIVVTNDDGRFLLPELPPANYQVWVRGYGLVDSTPVRGTAGQELSLTAVVASTPAEAAEVYPANYWLSLAELPAASEFPGTGPEGNGLHPDLDTQEEYIFRLNNCMRCHALGNKWTREIHSELEGEFESVIDSWDKRVRLGQRASGMNNNMTQLGRARGMQMFADWTERIAQGEVPPAPPRPQGLERNVVLTEWEWGTTMTKIHDLAATDKRNPRVAANSPVYGSDIARDMLSILDPVSNETRELLIPTLEDRTSWEPNYAQSGYVSRMGIDGLDRFNPTNIHNPMKDSGGRVWYTARLRPANLQPAFCQEGAGNKFADWYPIARGGRSVSFYDPATEEFTMIDTCFGTHHLQFAEDDSDTLYFSGGGPVWSWIDTKQFLASADGPASQGWCPTVVDTNDDGRITKPWNDPKGGGDNLEYPGFDPTQDTRIVTGAYGIITSPIDGSVWGARDSHPGTITRVAIGDNPPESCVAEVFEVPSERWGATEPGQEKGSRPRGIDIDRNGVIWTALASSAQLASFDRTKCEGPLTGPTAHTGRHCLEGWTLYPLPAPVFKGTDKRVDFYYYNYVDQFDTLGLGPDTPIATGTGSDSLIALKTDTKEPVFMRVPYPIGAFHPRGMDGRIDDPNAGWKGRGIYSASAQDTVWHAEDGLRYENGQWVNDQRPIIVKFQLRPDPLAN